jgi:hypothetical protein
MALQSLPGGFSYIGPRTLSALSITSFALDAANEAAIFVGRMATSDGASHTIDTTGSSSIGFRTGTVTFANGSTSVSVGVAPVDAANGPPARASNTANVIDFDVKGVLAGGGGGITNAAWQTIVPTTGTKTIASGDLVAVAIQMTARAGADSVAVGCADSITSLSRPNTTAYLSGVYGGQSGAMPLCIVTFSDGAYGWFEGSDIYTTTATRTWNSGSATKEYGQLYQMPFPMKVHGIYGRAAIGNDTDLILYSDPLGTPVAEKTVSIDANTLQSATARLFFEMFPAPYSVAANQPIGAVLKPGASNISTDYKTLAAAGHRVTDPWGTTGYGISRASGAFANANSSLDHYFLGLIVSAYEAGSSGAPHFSATIF